MLNKTIPCFSFLCALFFGLLSPELVQAQFWRRPNMKVINIETHQFVNARRDPDGSLRVYDRSFVYSNQTVIENQSPFRTFRNIHLPNFPSQSIFQTENGFYQVQNIHQLSSGEIYIDALKLFDEDDDEYYNRSARGLFLHSELVPIDQVIARQSLTSGRCETGTVHVNANNQERSQEWSQAIQVNYQAAMADAAEASESRRGQDELRYMTEMACLTNGLKILTQTQTRRITSGPVRTQFETQIFDVVDSRGVSVLAHGPDIFWQPVMRDNGTVPPPPVEVMVEAER